MDPLPLEAQLRGGGAAPRGRCQVHAPRVTWDHDPPRPSFRQVGGAAPPLDRNPPRILQPQPHFGEARRQSRSLPPTCSLEKRKTDTQKQGTLPPNSKASCPHGSSTVPEPESQRLRPIPHERQVQPEGSRPRPGKASSHRAKSQAPVWLPSDPRKQNLPQDSAEELLDVSCEPDLCACPRCCPQRSSQPAPCLGEGFMASTGHVLAPRGPRRAARTSNPSHGACGSPSKSTPPATGVRPDPQHLSTPRRTLLASTPLTHTSSGTGAPSQISHRDGGPAWQAERLAPRLSPPDPQPPPPPGPTPAFPSCLQQGEALRGPPAPCRAP